MAILNNDYTTGKLLNNEYISNNCNLIAIDLSKQIELEDDDLMQQINKWRSNNVFYKWENKYDNFYFFRKCCIIK